MSDNPFEDILHFFGLKRPEKEIRLEPVEKPEVEAKPEADYRISNIRAGVAHKFVGDVYHNGDRHRIGLAMGDSEAALVKHAKRITDAHHEVSKYKNKSIPL